MELKDYAIILRRRWVTVAISIVLVMGAFFAIAFGEKPQYSSQGKVLIRLDYPIRQLGDVGLFADPEGVLTRGTKENFLKSDYCARLAAAIYKHYSDKNVDWQKTFEDKTIDVKIIEALKAEQYMTNEGVVISQKVDDIARTFKKIVTITSDDKTQVVTIVANGQSESESIVIANSYVLAAHVLSKTYSTSAINAAKEHFNSRLKEEEKRRNELAKELKEKYGLTTYDIKSKEDEIDSLSKTIDDDSKLMREKQRRSNELSLDVQRLQALVTMLHLPLPPTEANLSSGGTYSALDQMLHKIRAELIEMRELRTDNTREVKKLLAQEKYFEQQKKEEYERLLADNISIAVSRRETIESEISILDGNIARASKDLKTKKEENKAILEYSQKLQAAETQISTLGSSVVRLEESEFLKRGFFEPFEPASTSRKAEPTGFKNLPLWIALAFILGIGAGYVKDYMDPNVYNEAELRKFANLDTISIIPVRETGKPELIRDYEAGDPFAELYFSLGTLLSSRLQRLNKKVIAVVSAVAAEGKTNCSCNLGFSLAMLKKKVLIIDGDLRKPSVAKMFGVHVETDLSELLEKGFDPDMLVKASIPVSSEHNLFILGQQKSIKMPQGLFEGENFTKMLALASAAFDYVIVDTPPVGVYAEALVVSSKAEGVLVVVGSGFSNKSSLRWIKHLLNSVNATVVGAVLNFSREPSTSGYYYYYTRYYYHGDKTKISKT